MDLAPVADRLLGQLERLVAGFGVRCGAVAMRLGRRENVAHKPTVKDSHGQVP